MYVFQEVSSEAVVSDDDEVSEGSDDECTLAGDPVSEESDSDDEESLASSIAELSSEINLKQQLVDQLERSQRNFTLMKGQYEEKMTVLQQQIRSVEIERDKVLKEISKHLIHSHTHTLIHSYTHTLTHSHSHTLTHSHSHTLTLSL